MTGITQRIEFSAGHRILGHTGKCRFLHGHNYHAELSYICDSLDPLGMVADFAEVKAVAKGWIDEHWDHNMILCKDDPLYKIFLLNKEGDEEQVKGLFAGRQPYILTGNPTAEVMAMELYRAVSNRVAANSEWVKRTVKLVSVTIQETDGCWAEFSPLVLNRR